MLRSQQNRSLAVSTPLGEDILLLRSMRGKERLSTLFKYQLELVSESSQPIRHQDLLGQPVTVRLDLPQGQTRYFNGIVSRFAHTGCDGDLAYYRATLVPWLWLLTRTSDCRIFQDRTVPDIVREICREHGYTDFKAFLISELYRPRDYCVQYRETDFDFISRLLEQEGIYYYFEHEHDRHTLILADRCSVHDPVPGYEKIPYYPPDKAAVREEHIDHWSVAGAIQSGAFVYTDFDYTAPRKDLWAGVKHPHEQARWELERYDYPGGYTQRDQGDDWVRARIEEQYVGYRTARGKGNARGLATGTLFTLTNEPASYPRDPFDPLDPLTPRRDQNREYLILAAEYELQSDAFGSASEAGTASSGPVFACKEFTALDTRTPFRPPRITPKPQIPSLQTALVVGPEGEEIWTDKYGRVKVQFHWDRYGKSNEHSSCWVRVSHPWVGKGWGAIAIPRIGQEVVVGFLDGDPDRPIITGGVYNDVNQPPYQLPDNATVTGLKSRSTKEGWGFNEIRLEDKKGEEQLFIQAEKDLEIQVKHERRLTVGASQFEAVGKDRTEQIGGDRRVEIQGNREEKVGGIASLQAQDVIIEAARSITLKVGDGHLVVDHTGVTSSNVPPNQPVINRGSPPLTWLQDLGNLAAQALTRAAAAETPFVAERPLNQAQATDDSHEGVDPSSEEKISSPEPATGNPLSDSDVQRGMQGAWTDSQASDPANRHEEGGYIVRESDGTYGVERWPRGQGANIPPPHRDSSGNYNGKEVVGEFHTHPNPPIDETGRTWTQGGHTGDWNGIAAENYPGDSYIISRDSIWAISPSGQPNLDNNGNEIPIGNRQDLIGN